MKCVLLKSQAGHTTVCNRSHLAYRPHAGCRLCYPQG